MSSSTSLLSLLRDQLLPDLLMELGTDRTLHAWVDGCFTGEPAYVTAIAISEAMAQVGGAVHVMRIYGSDVSRHAIELARQAWYRPEVAEQVSSPLLSRYFEREGDGYRVRASLRAACTFLREDLLGHVDVPPVHLVVCNTFDHLSDAEQRQRLARFHYALRDRGRLIVLNSQAPRDALPGFEPLDAAQGVYVRAANGPTDAAQPETWTQPPPQAYATLRDRPPPEQSGMFLRPPTIGFCDAVTTASMPVLMVDEHDVIVFANATAARTFGYTVDALIGMSPDALTPPHLRAAYAEERRWHLAQDATRWVAGTVSRVGLHSDGREIPLEISMGVVSDAGARLLVGFLDDKSERHEIERQVHVYQEKLRQLALESALVEERERRRLAADLHDRLGQSLALAKLKLAHVRSHGNEAVRQPIDDAIAMLAQAIADTHDLTFDLSPPVLYDLGLIDALGWLTADFKRRHGLSVTLQVHTQDVGLDTETAAIVFRSVREALLNVLKHGETSRAMLTLARRPQRLLIAVIDHGVGFDLNRVERSTQLNGFGLFSLRERIERLGGRVTIVSSPGRGTHIAMEIPCRAEQRPKSA